MMKMKKEQFLLLYKHIKLRQNILNQQFLNVQNSSALSKKTNLLKKTLSNIL